MHLAERIRARAEQIAAERVVPAPPPQLTLRWPDAGFVVMEPVHIVPGMSFVHGSFVLRQAP